ncbi:D-amino acid dehydrogenase small subunit [Maliponia aquimaris]|uniref:D-amino acid dehydrogenase small subunit n=2 Tax=Maliponia aquimaris TaxID=1673631 RepID=A0A238L6B8_9RHOB|nr:FAD-dependent oxidoreductase [Maliponia aquimaris]SMX50371.1 D-amino acid dehydrogenase small subunit [Maliponia aquimaris]
MADPQHVAVIGAGMVGVSTALWLQRRGVRVTLIDREGPAAGASQGNGGVLASIAVVPVPVPGLLRKAPGMLFDPNQPLFLKWGYLPRLLPFLARYLPYGRADRVERISQGLTTLLHDSPDQHAALAAGTAAAEYIRPGSYVYGYESRAAYEQDAFGWELKRRRGLPFHEMDAEALAAFDPALTGRFGFGVNCTGLGFITDPGAYVRALAAHFTESGGTQVTATVSGFRAEGGRAVAALTDQGEIAADGFALTLGAWSGAIARDLGITVPLESERGYHVEFHDPNLTLRGPVMVAAGKFVATPMQGRLRAAGIVEFGGLKATPSRAPFDLMRRSVARIFPDLTYSHTTEWMGHRPATADSLPVIGPAPRLPNVWLGYGHHHVGLTGGPKTGRWLAQMMTGATVNEDLSPYAADRRV